MDTSIFHTQSMYFETSKAYIVPSEQCWFYLCAIYRSDAHLDCSGWQRSTLILQNISKNDKPKTKNSRERREKFSWTQTYIGQKISLHRGNRMICQLSCKLQYLRSTLNSWSDLLTYRVKTLAVFAWSCSYRETSQPCEKLFRMYFGNMSTCIYLIVNLWVEN